MRASEGMIAAKTATLKIPELLACLRMFVGTMPVQETTAPRMSAQIVPETPVHLPITNETHAKNAVIARLVKAP